MQFFIMGLQSMVAIVVELPGDQKFNYWDKVIAKLVIFGEGV
jgi:hypothetical protein